VPAANGRRLQEDLQERLGRPVFIDNDANCFALSEAMDAANHGVASVLGVILGTGVGAGMIFRGQIHNGLNHVAGELGHMRLPIDALQAFGGDLPVFACGCGQRGCIDNYLSGRGFEQLFFHRFSERLAAVDIIQRYREGHPATVVFVEQFFELMACCFAGYLAILDPALIVLGGGLSNFDELYRELPKRLPRYMLKFARVPRIEKARHGDAGGVRGAAFLPLSAATARGTAALPATAGAPHHHTAPGLAASPVAGSTPEQAAGLAAHLGPGLPPVFLSCTRGACPAVAVLAIRCRERCDEGHKRGGSGWRCLMNTSAAPLFFPGQRPEG